MNILYTLILIFIPRILCQDFIPLDDTPVFISYKNGTRVDLPVEEVHRRFREKFLR